MTNKQLPSPDLLRKLLRYDPETGKLFWLKRPRNFFASDKSCAWWNKMFGEKEALCFVDSFGYKVGTIRPFRVKAHRVIWAMQTGAWPQDEIDHTNQDKLDNRWSNLRSATSSENSINRPVKNNTSSKYVGVSWSKVCKKWHAYIGKERKKYNLGFFECEIEAAKTYDKAARNLHGEFANLNFP